MNTLKTSRNWLQNLVAGVQKRGTVRRGNMRVACMAMAESICKIFQKCE